MHPRTMVCLFLLLAFCSAPVLGATKYLGSSPELSAAIAGTNEFTPGQDATISIVVQNSGLNTYKFVNEGTIERDDLPNTAKLVTIGLSAGTAPIVVKTDLQMVGDIKGTGTVTVKINAKISSNATAGEYSLPLIIQYKYLEKAEQDASDNIQFFYKPVNQTFPLTIRIKPQVKIDVLEATPESLNVGTEGYLNLRIQNIGSDDGKKATVKIIRNGASPIVPTDSSVFVGDFSAGSVVTCRYKVAISSNAEKQTYPVDVAVTYENNEGTVVTSAPDTIGVPVGGKTEFIVVSEPARVNAGSKRTIVVEYRNAGETPIYSAQARISAVDPFTSNDDTAYLGTIQPGEFGTARYEVIVNGAAIPKEYALDSEVRYRDALDNSQISDMLKVRVLVGAEPGSGNPFANPLVLLPIAAAIIGAGYYVLVMRKKK
jgi:hypothetical protein